MFRPDSRLRTQIRAVWAVEDYECLFGLVGNLDPVKGHGRFLAAAARVAAQRCDARFVCVGDGPRSYATSLRRASEVLGLGGRLLWAGGRSDVPAVLNALDVLVSASDSEGFPNVVAEAMACGVPCVVTDVGDSALIVGDTGVIVRERTSDALAAGMNLIADRLRRDGACLRSSVRRRVVESFAADRMLQLSVAHLGLGSVSCADENTGRP